MWPWLAGLNIKVLGYAVLGAALAAVTLWSYTQGLRIDALKANLEECKADVEHRRTQVAQCKEGLRAWSGKVNEQNEYIQKMRADSLARAQESARLLARTRAAAVTAEVRAKELEAKLAAPTPPGADARQAVSEIRAQLDLGGGK